MFYNIFVQDAPSAPARADTAAIITFRMIFHVFDFAILAKVIKVPNSIYNNHYAVY